MVVKNVVTDDFDRWIADYGRIVRGLAARYVGWADADEVAQEAFVAAWRNLERYDALRGSERAWLLAITADRARRHLRLVTRRERLRSILVRSAENKPNADPSIQLALAESLKRLSKRQRLAVELFYFLDLPVAEVALVMGCSTGTVKSTLHDARHAATGGTRGERRMNDDSVDRALAQAGQQWRDCGSYRSPFEVSRPPRRAASSFVRPRWVVYVAAIALVITVAATTVLVRRAQRASSPPAAATPVLHLTYHGLVIPYQNLSVTRSLMFLCSTQTPKYPDDSVVVAVQRSDVAYCPSISSSPTPLPATPKPRRVLLLDTQFVANFDVDTNADVMATKSVMVAGYSARRETLVDGDVRVIIPSQSAILTFEGFGQSEIDVIQAGIRSVTPADTECASHITSSELVGTSPAGNDLSKSGVVCQYDPEPDPSGQYWLEGTRKLTTDELEFFREQSPESPVTLPVDLPFGSSPLMALYRLRLADGSIVVLSRLRYPHTPVMPVVY